MYWGYIWLYRDSIEKAFFSNEEVQTSEKNAIETAN